MSQSRGCLTLREMTEVNDVLIPLTSSGRPLEEGVRMFLPQSHGRVKHMLQLLHHKLDLGIPLDEAVQDDALMLPEVYQTMVSAGMVSGRLPQILEMFSVTLDKLISIRQQIGRAMIYPFLVCLTAYLLFIYTIVMIVTRFEDFFVDQRDPLPGALVIMVSLRDSAWSWWWIPLLIMIVMWAWWLLTNDGQWLQRGKQVPMKMIPGLKGVLANFQRANFARLLAMLLQENLPYQQSLMMTAQATGMTEVLAVLERDDISTSKSTGGVLRDQLSPYLAWVIQTGQESNNVITSLQNAASLYQRRAERMLLIFQLVFPVVLLGLVGGAATLMYALAIFVPITQTFEQLSQIVIGRGW